jgi:hypothetical protein
MTADLRCAAIAYHPRKRASCPTGALHATSVRMLDHAIRSHDDASHLVWHPERDLGLNHPSRRQTCTSIVYISLALEHRKQWRRARIPKSASSERVLVEQDELTGGFRVNDGDRISVVWRSHVSS